jgi:murein L,D-transpeptidase YcbB/YkuD
MAATAQELAALKAQIITELLPTLQKFVQNQPAAQAVEKTDREQRLEKRAQERKEARAEQRKGFLEKLQKNKDAGHLENLPKPVQKTAINDTPRPNPANDPIKFVWNGGAQAAAAADANADVDLSGLQSQINALTSRLDAASITADCSTSGDVTVTLNL